MATEFYPNLFLMILELLLPIPQIKTPPSLWWFKMEFYRTSVPNLQMMPIVCLLGCPFISQNLIVKRPYFYTHTAGMIAVQLLTR